MSSSLYSEAVELINAAKLSQDNDEKLKLIAQIEELLVHRAANDALLVTELHDKVLEFQVEPVASIRRAVANFIDELCSKRPDLFPSRIADSLAFLLSDEQAPVVLKRSLMALTNVLRPVIGYVLQDPQPPNTLQVQAWTKLWRMKAAGLSLTTHSNDGVRTQGVKFAEALVTICATETFPRSHPLITASAMQAEASRQLTLLTQMAATEQSGSVLGVLIMSLGTVGRTVPAYQQAVVPSLIAMLGKIETVPKTQRASCQHALRTAVLSLIKNCKDNMLLEQMYTAFAGLNLPKSNMPVATATAPAQPQQPLQPAVPTGLPASLLSALPQQMPAAAAAAAAMPLMYGAPGGFGMAPAAAAGAVSDAPVVRDPRKRLRDEAAAAAAAKRLQGDGGAPASMPVVAAAAPLQPTPMSVVAPSVPPTVATVSIAAPVAPAALSIPTITAPPMSEDFCHLITEQSVMRILHNRLPVVMGGAAHIRSGMLIRIASFYDLESTVCQAMLQAIIADPDSECEFASEWLVAELAYGLELGDLSRYEFLVSALSESLATHTSRQVIRIIAAVPLFTPEAADALQAWCTSPDRYSDGLAALYELLRLRPPCRKTCLSVLFAAVLADDESARASAVQLAVGPVLAIPALGQRVEEFALREALSLQQEHDEETCTRKLRLLVELASKKPAFLQRLFDVYGQIAPVARKALDRMTDQLLDALPDPAWIISLLPAVPRAAEPLMLHCLYSLTDKAGGPMPDLVVAVRALYNERRDARLLVPVITGLSKFEILQALPQIVLLDAGIMRNALLRLLNPKTAVAPLAPAELLVALHLLDPAVVKGQIALQAMLVCYQQPAVYTQQVFAVALQQMVDMTPVPPLLARTVIQGLEMYPNLKTFVTTTVLPALVMRKAWTNRMLWQGFLIVCQKTAPTSYAVLLTLPDEFLAQFLDQYPVHVGNLLNHASKHREYATKLPLLQERKDKAKAAATPQTPQSATPTAAVTATAAAAAGDPVAPPPVTAPTVILQQQPKSRPAPPPPPAQQQPVEPAGGEVEMQDGERTPEGPRTPETPE